MSIHEINEMTKKSFCSWLLWAGLGAACARASGPGDEAVVVYNTRVPESKELAEYYAQKRQVPAAHLFGYSLPNREEISRAEFRDMLEQPLAKALQDRKLWVVGPKAVPATTNQPAHTERRVVSSSIRYAVLCYGVPLRISEDPSLKETGVEKVRPELRQNTAAVDSELAILPLLECHIPLTGPFSNPLYGTTNAASLNPTNGVLLVARLDGPTPAIARGLVDKALEAEANGLWGRAYFDLRNTTDPGLKPGDDWIRNAAEFCRRLGFETVVDQNNATFPASFPMSQIAFYAGWYDEHVSGPFARPTVEFMPGAFAYHLHSWSAVSLRSTNRNWVGPLLAKGVTATMGSVFEPYLIGTPDIGVVISRLIYPGFSFGEAACAGQGFLSWETTVVGDPLYRPFGHNLDQMQLDLERRDSRFRDWGYLRLADLNLANGKPPAQVVAILESMPLTRKSPVLSEKLADLYALLGKPSSAVFEYTRALTLEPSPWQRVRLRLALGEKLSGLDRFLEAYQNYEKLIEEMPDYPDKPAIYRLLLPLARKLDRQADVEKLEAALTPAGK